MVVVVGSVVQGPQVVGVVVGVVKFTKHFVVFFKGKGLHWQIARNNRKLNVGL